jgi:hypothetical protein
MGESHLRRLALEHSEGIGMHIAAHGQVVAAGSKVLADRQHVDAMRTHISHDVEDFLVGLSEANHEAALCGHAGHGLPEALEQVQREGIVGAGSGLFVQAGHRFEIVVHHVRRGGLEDVQGAIHATAEIGREDLDARGRRHLAHPLNA